MELKFGSYKNKELQKEWKLFGEDKFVFEVLSELKHKEEEANYKEELKILEELYFEKLEPYNEKGYNKQSFL